MSQNCFQWYFNGRHQSLWSTLLRLQQVCDMTFLSACSVWYISLYMRYCSRPSPRCLSLSPNELSRKWKRSSALRKAGQLLSGVTWKETYWSQQTVCGIYTLLYCLATLCLSFLITATPITDPYKSTSFSCLPSFWKPSYSPRLLPPMSRPPFASVSSGIPGVFSPTAVFSKAGLALNAADVFWCAMMRSFKMIQFNQ